jgi:thymidylate synthase
MSKKLTKEEFLEKLKTDRDFNNRYGRNHITKGKMVLPPCHYGFQIYTRELSAQERLEWVKVNLPNIDVNGFVNNDEYSHKWVETLSNNIPKRAISLMWNQRSVDTFLGLPFNIASYGLLLEIIAKAVNMVPDELIGNLGDTHLYLNHIEQAKEQIGREPFELPTLNMAKTDAFWNGFDVSLFSHLESADFQVENYQAHPTIKAPLSN